MADSGFIQTVMSLFPKTRREFSLVVPTFLAGVGLTIGAIKNPYFTFEPAELSECRVELVTANIELANQKEKAEDLKDRLSRCWQLSRSDRSPRLMLDEPDSEP